jgi:hypothetical protein
MLVVSWMIVISIGRADLYLLKLTFSVVVSSRIRSLTPDYGFSNVLAIVKPGCPMFAVTKLPR